MFQKIRFGVNNFKKMDYLAIKKNKNDKQKLKILRFPNKIQISIFFSEHASIT